MDHRAGVVVFVGLQLVLRATPLRPADARGDPEPPHGGGDGHLDRARRHAGVRARLGGRGIAGVALSQIDNVSPNLGQGYIIDSFMVVVFGGVGNLWGTAFGALMIGVANKMLEPLIGAVQGQIVL